MDIVGWLVNICKGGPRGVVFDSSNLLLFNGSYIFAATAMTTEILSGRDPTSDINTLSINHGSC